MEKDKKSRSKSTTRKSKPKEVKARGPTGWNLYLAEHRQAVKDKEEINDKEAMKLIGEMWRDLTDEEVEAYNEKAKEITKEMIKNGEVDPDLANSKKRKSPSKSKSKNKDKKKYDDKKKKDEDESEDEEKDKKNKNKDKDKDKDTKGKKPESNKNKKDNKKDNKDNKKKKNAEEEDDDEEEE